MPPERPSRPKLARITDGCFAAVIRTYLDSPKFQGRSAATKDLWGRQLRLAERPDLLGAYSIYEIRPALVQAFLDGLADRPAKAAAAKAALRSLEKWAVVRDLIPYPIMTGTEVEPLDGGHTPWSDDQVLLAEQHARPEVAMAITLAANTGQRGSDLVRMRWSDLEPYQGRPGINVTQMKTGLQLWVPLTEPLQAVMGQWERRPSFILARQETPWKRKGLTNAWSYERDTNEALGPLKAAGLVLHGLRATACVRLLRAGANTRQIADMVGMSEETVKGYCRLSDQRENALAAVYILDRKAREKEDRKT